MGIQIMNYEGTNIDIDLKKIPFKEAKDKYTIERMNNIYRFLNGKDITKKQWIIFNYHAFTYRNNYERNTTPILRDLN